VNWLIVMLAILAFALGYFCGLKLDDRKPQTEAEKQAAIDTLSETVN